MKRFASTIATIALAGALSSVTPSHAATGVNSCYLSRNSVGTSTCDYVGAGLFTVIDFNEISGNATATVTCGVFTLTMYTDSHREVMTGPTVCRLTLTQHNSGSSTLSVYNKVA